MNTRAARGRTAPPWKPVVGPPAIVEDELGLCVEGPGRFRLAEPHICIRFL